MEGCSLLCVSLCGVGWCQIMHTMFFGADFFGVFDCLVVIGVVCTILFLTEHFVSSCRLRGCKNKSQELRVNGGLVICDRYKYLGWYSCC